MSLPSGQQRGLGSSQGSAELGFCWGLRSGEGPSSSLQLSENTLVPSGGLGGKLSFSLCGQEAGRELTSVPPAFIASPCNAAQDWHTAAAWPSTAPSLLATYSLGGGTLSGLALRAPALEATSGPGCGFLAASVQLTGPLPVRRASVPPSHTPPSDGVLLPSVHISG